MNTLKPLLIVAVLGGIGYGVYVRLNRGNGAPPPPVAEGWNAAPEVQLPGEPGTAPWGPPAGQPPAVSGAGGGEAPPYPGAVAQAPPGPSAPPTQAPPFDSVASPAAGPNLATGSPPFAANQAPAAPRADPTPLPAEIASQSPASTPGAPAAAPGTHEAPIADPYAEPYDATVPERYRTPSPDAAAPSAATPWAGNPATDQASPGGNEPPAAGASGTFAAAYESAQRELEGGQMAAALRRLSKWYDNPELSPAEQQQLTALLDQVAGTVVYSTQNLLEPPYEVRPGERLQDIGEKYNVPWQLLAKINGIDDPSALRAGERLKVVRGPFQAIVSLEKRELTLFAADGSYAGRFKVGIGSDNPPREGTFPVAEKAVNPVYRGRQRVVSAEDADNPLGERWIGLGGGVGIHGTNDPQNIGRAELPGSISLSERDVTDVYDILSVGSRVTIRR